MAAKKRYEGYTKIRKTEEMIEVFKRKSGPINKRPTRTTEKAQWKKEVENETS